MISVPARTTLPALSNTPVEADGEANRREALRPSAGGPAPGNIAAAGL